MFDDEASGSVFGNASQFYKVAKFPTKNIHTPIALIYGGIDSLVEYLPSHTVANTQYRCNACTTASAHRCKES
jgi:lysosomal acid lipase/cholesteryl ester hydrolase